jgi:hypothetical protein
MANLNGGAQAFSGDTSVVDSTAQHALGTRAKDASGNEYIYMQGIGSTIAGSVVTYDEAFLTALIAANAIGPVAVAMAAIVANKFGWYCVFGSCDADVVASSADNATVGRETTDGKVGDGRAAGDEIIGMVQREATTGAALATVQLTYPFVNDKTGS